MKKLIALTIFLSICLTFVYGCTNSTTPTAVAKKIDKNLNTLYTAVSNLDTIDNSYIANPDIYNIENIAQTSTIKKTIAAPPSSVATKIETEKINALLEVDETEESIENINTINQTENLNNFNEPENDNNETLNDENINNSTTSSTTNTNSNIDIVFEDEITNDSNLNDVLIIDDEGNGTLLNEDGEIIDDTTEIPQEKLDEIFESTIKDPSLTEDKKEKVYVFLFDKIRYTPRYANNYNTEIAQTTLNNYLYKVQELYTMTADVVEANNVLADEKKELLNCIDNLRIINNKMLEGKITPNNQQLIALNNYVQDIKTTIKRIKASNGQLNNEINNISTTSSNYGLSKGVDIINSNYLKILNHIDARITYFKSAIATLDQIHYILNEAQLELNYQFDEEPSKVENNKNLIPENSQNIDTYKSNSAIETNDNNSTISKNYTNIDSFNNDLKNNNLINNYNVDDNIYIVDDNFPSVSKHVNIDNATNLNNVGTTTIHNLPNNNNDVNAPNGTFQNGIITQNNLNNGTNNGINGTLSGYSGSSEYVDYFKQNNMNRTDKNINTYGQNSLVDMINNGTVNNGINTLNLNEKETSNKPVMVDNLLEDEKNNKTKLEQENVNLENANNENSEQSITNSNSNFEENLLNTNNESLAENQEENDLNDISNETNCENCLTEIEENINNNNESNTDKTDNINNENELKETA